ncbi:MAG: co-chaperone DjlA [Methylococcaceae bacterium]
MSWLGKVVGGILGFSLVGPVGALLGATLGHQFDRNLQNIGLLDSDLSPESINRAQWTFFDTTFLVLGYIAKADGRVSEAELNAARVIMDRMELPDEIRKVAANLYNQGKQPDFVLEEALDKLRADCARRHALFRRFLEWQMECAYADGELVEAKELILQRIADFLGITRFEFRLIKTRAETEQRLAQDRKHQKQDRRMRNPAKEAVQLVQAYALLGIPVAASEAEVKKAYRKQMSLHHPDKLTAQGASPDNIRLATEKTQQIRRAYELIARIRKF